MMFFCPDCKIDVDTETCPNCLEPIKQYKQKGDPITLGDRIKELEEQVLSLKKYKELKDYMGMPDDILMAKIQELEAALREYGRHKRGCPKASAMMMAQFPDSECTCGLGEFLKKEG